MFFLYCSVCLKFQADCRVAAAVLHVMRWVEKNKGGGLGAKQKMTMQKWTATRPSRLCGLFVLQYLLGGGVKGSGADGHAAGSFDEPRPTLLSVEPHLEMDSNVQHDDGCQIQGHDWAVQADDAQSKTDTKNSFCKYYVMFFLIYRSFLCPHTAPLYQKCFRNIFMT